MTSISIAALAFMLVVTTITANPVRNKEKLTNQDRLKAIKYFWNEEIGKDRGAQIMNLWNEHVEEAQNKRVYTMREDGDRRKGDGDKDKEINFWNKERVNNKGHFKAKIEEPGRHTHYFNCHTHSLHLCISHPIHINYYSDCWTKPCSSASDCCSINPTCACRTICECE